MIVYTSDNGFFLGESGLFDKRLMYEPSIRVPMLVRHPASIPAGQVNREQMVLNVDVAPTFLDAGGRARRRRCRAEAGCRSRRASAANWRKDFLYEYFEFPAAHCVRKHRGVRTKRWKLIHWDYPQEWELYDLAADPHEKSNLSGQPRYAAEEQSCARGWPRFAASSAMSIRPAMSRGIRPTSNIARRSAGSPRANKDRRRAHARSLRGVARLEDLLFEQDRALPGDERALFPHPDGVGARDHGLEAEDPRRFVTHRVIRRAASAGRNERGKA